MSSSDEHELSLLHAVVARPDDDNPVAVYGDFLSERGDPRGEFIALSLAESRGQKVKSKLKAFEVKHRGAINGPIQNAVWGRPVFRRGLHDEICVSGFAMPPQERPVAARDPRWFTVRKLQFPLAKGDPFVGALLESAPLWALERIEQAVPSQLEVAASRRFPWALKELQLTEIDHTLSQMGGAFPALRTLEFIAPRVVPAELWTCQLFEQLNVLIIKTPLEAPPAAELVGLCTQLRELGRFEVRTRWLALHGRRVGQQFELRLEIEDDSFLDPADLAGFLKIPKARIASVTVDGPPGKTERISAAVHHLR